MKKLLALLTLLALPVGATELSDRVRIPEFRRDTGKPIYVASLAPLASMPALFQIIPGGGGGGAGGIIPGTTVITGGTDKRVFYDDNGVVNEAVELLWDKTAVSLTFGTAGAGTGQAIHNKTMSGGATTSNFLSVTGTTPATLTAAGYAANFQITGAGSSAQDLVGVNVDLLAGYTGNQGSYGLRVTNASVSTGATPFATTPIVSAGVFGLNSAAGSAMRFGGYFQANGATSNVAYGVAGYANVGTTRVGVAGLVNPNAGTNYIGGYFGTTQTGAPTLSAGVFVTNGTLAAPIAILTDNAAAVSSAAAWAGVAIQDGGQPQNGLGVLTSSTATVTNASEMRSVISRYDITNAMVTALGAVGAGDVQIATLPAKTIVKNAYIVIDTPDTSANALTIAFGRVSATYIDYIVASDAKGAANTVYGDASAERGTNLTGYDLPSYTATTGVFCHFIKTATNLSTVTGFTAHVIIETTLAP